MVTQPIGPSHFNSVSTPRAMDEEFKRLKQPGREVNKPSSLHTGTQKAKKHYPAQKFRLGFRGKGDGYFMQLGQDTTWQLPTH